MVEGVLGTVVKTIEKNVYELRDYNLGADAAHNDGREEWDEPQTLYEFFDERPRKKVLVEWDNGWTTSHHPNDLTELSPLEQLADIS